MKKLILIIIIALSSLMFISCTHEKQLLRKASVAVDACDYARAIDYYDQILLTDSNSFSGNAGKGIVLSEYMGRYEQAIPYLEKALKKSPEKNVMKIDNDLGKSYHFLGNYPRALYYYSKVAEKNKQDNADYDHFLSKRIADCRYALDHPEVAAVDQQSVSNTGNAVNTEMPDYDPVYVNGQLIFTSKRKDTPKERKNGIDGRYFESMYIANLKDGNFANTRRYTLPDKGTDSRYKKGNESVLSASSNGKALYIFRSGMAYEADLTDSTKAPKLLPENINFTDFQSGAFISQDGKTMVFSADAPNGRGGTDIYISQKNDEGKWSSPRTISFDINTSYNEDSPFLTEDGKTLYYCSNGLPGYGGYDIYKSELIDGEWTKPVNLGQPINTPGDETHFSLLPNSSKGYYASNRQGGYGDMDIYNVHYVQQEIPECEHFDSLLVLNAEPKGTSKTDYVFTALIPDQYKGHVKSINWKVNGQDIAATGERVEYSFDGQDIYRIYAKVLAYCDNCEGLKAVCNEKDIIPGEAEIPVVITEAVPKKELNVRGPKMSGNEVMFGKFDNDQLSAIGWKIIPALFDYNGTTLRSETKEMLDHNIDVLKNNKELSVVVNGYADSRGTEICNLRLSERRANMVKQYMIQQGISRSRIRTKGYGESKIENGCSDGISCDESQHQANRKVDFYISNDQKSITGLNR